MHIRTILDWLAGGPRPWLFLPAFAVALTLSGCGDASGGGASAESSPGASASNGEATTTPPETPSDQDTATSAALPVVGLDEIEAMIDEAAANDRVLVIDFWATWCVPCVAMFPDLHAGLKARGEAVRPVSITLDGPGEAEAKAVAFLHKHDAMKDAYRVEAVGAEQERIVDALGDRWQDVVIPAILVFDQDGELAGEFLEGGDATVRAILERVDELLAE